MMELSRICTLNCSVALIFGIIFLNSPSLVGITSKLKLALTMGLPDQSLPGLWGKLVEFEWLYWFHLHSNRIYSLTPSKTINGASTVCWVLKYCIFHTVKLVCFHCSMLDWLYCPTPICL